MDIYYRAVNQYERCERLLGAWISLPQAARPTRTAFLTL